MAAPIPKKIGKYEVLDVVGRGGMGVVYRAKDPFLDRMVAIKIMTISYTDNPDLLQRFYREAKATANLQHPNIVTVYELGEHEGSPYLAMQFLEGASLEAMVRSGQPMTLLQKVDIIVQACHGLSYAHQRGIVHRDIKPGNIMVLKDRTVKIVDFGIARIGDTNFTRTGQFMGSLNYMSLEQLNDKLTVDQRTDVYSTGVVLYQILTGALPFEADSTGATLMKILNDAPPPFSKYTFSYPPEIETITMKALAKDRDQRYSSADELAFDLSQLQDRLRKDQVEAHMQRAEALLQQNQIFQANDELLEVLKLDKQHSKASTMLRTLRKQIEKEQSAERARQLCEQAEEACRREDFEPALAYLDQALSLDPTNTNLQQFRAKVQAAKAEIEHLRQVMQRAENAHRAGNLDTAKLAIEEVLARRPDDTRVKSLYRIIQKELDERQRQKRVENLLEAARKEMSNRRYTAAFDMLKEAEKVDADAPALRSLMETFTAARDQEVRRRELEGLTHQIEQALNTDDPQTALNLLADGLKRFPNEPALLKFKDIAETQKRSADMKAFVRERSSVAREILNAGNATGALKVLQEALKKAPGNPNLESLISIAQERQTQDRDEQARAKCMQQANDALGRKAYDEAIRILEAGQLRFAASSDIDNLLRFAHEQQGKEAAQQHVERSVRRAQELLRAQEYDSAIQLLESVVARTPDEELSIVLEEARRRRDDFHRQIAAAIARGQQFLNEGSVGKAAEFLQGQPTAFRKSEEFRQLLMAAASQARPPEQAMPVETPEEMEAPEPAKTMMWGGVAPPEVEPSQKRPAQTPKGAIPVKTTPAKPVKPAAKGFLQQLSQRQKMMAAGVAAAVLVILMVVTFWPSAEAGTLIVRSNVDGAMVFVGGKAMGTVDSSHPLTLKLKEGHYPVEVRKDGFDTTALPVDIAKGQEVELPVNLTPVGVPTGTVTVLTSEDGTDVFVDDALKGSTTGKKLSLALPTGHHEIRVEKQGFDAVPSQLIDLAANGDAQVKFGLVATKGPVNEAPKDSYLVITGTRGAGVKIDGASRGFLTGTALYLKVGPDASHRVEGILAGYAPFSKDVAVKSGERVQVSLTLTPVLKSKPLVASFTGPTDAIPPGHAHIAWETRNASAVEIDGVGSDLGATGSRDVNISQTTTFRLVAKGEGGTTEQTLTIRVTAPAKAAAIVSFSANPPKIKPGDSTTLTWATTDAQSVTIDGVGANLALSGSQQVLPQGNTTYRLAATGAGGSASSVIQVIVEAPSLRTSSETVAIKDFLGKFREAYNLESVPVLAKVWPTMRGDQRKALEELFKRLRAIDLQLDSCTNPTVPDPAPVGTTASLECTEKIDYTDPSGSRRTLPPQRLLITLKKTGTGWMIDSYAGKK